MKKKKLVNIYYVDNDLIALDNFRKRFNPDYDNYVLYTFNSVQRFFVKLNNSYKNKLQKIVIMDNLVISRGLKTKTALELISPIKNIDKDISIIIFADSDNLDLNATAGNVRVSAFLKKDDYFFIKLYPLINRLVSEYELKQKTKTTMTTVIFGLAPIAE